MQVSALCDPSLRLVQDIEEAPGEVDDDGLIGEGASDAVQGGGVAGFPLSGIGADLGGAGAEFLALSLDGGLEVADEVFPDADEGHGDGDVDGGGVL